MHSVCWLYVMAQTIRERVPSGELHSPRDKPASFLPSFSSEAWTSGEPAEDKRNGTF